METTLKYNWYGEDGIREEDRPLLHHTAHEVISRKLKEKRTSGDLIEVVQLANQSIVYNGHWSITTDTDLIKDFVTN